ncbi:SPOR domain-containing protein [Bosea sp. NPDC055332]
MTLPSKDILERIKLAFGIAIGGLLLVLLTAMLIWPGRVAGGMAKHLAAAGIEVSKFAFLGVEAKIIKAGEVVEEAAAKARSELDKANARLAELQHLLRCLGAGTCSAAEQAKIAALRTSAADPSPVMEAAREDLDNVIKVVRQATAVLTTLAPLVSTGERAWIAISGGDRDLAAAQHEVEKLRAAGFPAGQIGLLLQDGWYRTVLYYPTREAANNAATAIAKALGRQPYFREFNRWCPNAVEVENKFVRCGAA